MNAHTAVTEHTCLHCACPIVSSPRSVEGGYAHQACYETTVDWFRGDSAAVAAYFQRQGVAATSDKALRDAVALVLAMHAHPECVPTGYSVHLDPMAVNQLRAALAPPATSERTRTARFTIESDGFELSGFHTDYDTLADAHIALNAILAYMRNPDLAHGWHTCPPSHREHGCRWVKVSLTCGFDTRAVECWRHDGTLVPWQSERIYIRDNEKEDC
jgi:hypothetical protein